MAFMVEQNKAFDPIDRGLFSAGTVGFGGGMGLALVVRRPPGMSLCSVNPRHEQKWFQVNAFKYDDVDTPKAEPSMPLTATNMPS